MSWLAPSGVSAGVVTAIVPVGPAPVYSSLVWWRHSVDTIVEYDIGCFPELAVSGPLVMAADRPTGGRSARR